MDNKFSKFKERQNRLRLFRTLLIGGAVGILALGLCLILSKLDILGFAPIFSLPIGIGVFLVCGAVVYHALKGDDRRLAKELDESFGLKEKVQTMLEFEGKEGDMLVLQRRDANESLARISPDKLKIKKLWIYITAISVATSILIASLFVPNIWKINQNPPYSLSEYQEAGILELIRYVGTSEMEVQYRDMITAELTALLEELRSVDNEKEMRAALGESMAFICAVTYESSNSTEILNILWNTGDKYLRYFAKWLDTSASYDEGEFAEGLIEYLAILTGDENEELTEEEKQTAIYQALDGMVRKYDIAFKNPGVPEDDGILTAIRTLFASEEEGGRGLSLINADMSSLNYEQAKAQVTAAFYGVYEEMYAAVLAQKINTNVGEYTMTRLAGLFRVPLPEFERPGFVKTGEAVEGGKADEDEEDEGGSSDGGAGEGATFGSKDLVLDPITGNYVEFGKLIDTYYGKMNEKLENGSYTEEQKQMILKYFALLYSGIKEEEGK